MMKIEEPTFGICRGCSEYNVCLGGIHEDCELGYEDYLNSDDVIVIVKNVNEDKVFHVIERSDDLKLVQDVQKVIDEEHKNQEYMITRKNGVYSLYTYPVIGNGEYAHFGN